MQTYEMSERQACRLLSISRTVFRYAANLTDDHEISQELLRLADRQPRYVAETINYLHFP